jgi:transposase
MTTKSSPNAPALHLRRKTLLAELSSLDQLRRGSITDQCIHAKRKDGSTVRCGPYPLLTCKRGNKTLSKRLSDPALVPLYRQQIAAMRQFESIVGQLVQIGEQLADLTLAQEAEKKTLDPTRTIGGGSPSARRSAKE